MNFFESLMEGIEDNYEVEVGTGLGINTDLTAEMESAEFEQGIEVMEMNKFLVTTKLGALDIERACLEAEGAEIDAFFLGEGVISNAKDKLLELWEKFKEWVQGILAKVKVFFAKFAMSRKAMAQLDIQLKKAKSSEKYKDAIRHLGIAVKSEDFDTAKGAMAELLKSVNQVTGNLQKNNVDALKIAVGKLESTATVIENGVKEAIRNDEWTGQPVSSFHKDVIVVIGGFVKGLETSLKAAQTAQRKFDRLDRGIDPKLDSDAVTQMRGIINVSNRIYAAHVKYFFHEVKVAKNIVAYVGKDAKLDKDESKDTGKIKGMAKF